MTKSNELIDGDYFLADRAAWFTVDGFSVRIHTADEGIIVDIYRLNEETQESIAGTYAFYSELDTDNGLDQ